MIAFACPHCASKIQARDESKGRRVACPFCAEPVLVPATGERPPPPAPPRPPPDTDEQPPRRRGPPTTSSFARLAPGATEARVGARDLLVGVLLTLLVSGALYLLRTALGGLEFADKFLYRGWTPYASLFLAFWSLAILVGRYRLVRLRDRHLELDYVPVEHRLETEAEREDIIKKAEALARKARDESLGPRIGRALEHFQATGNLMEVTELLGDESARDEAELASHYTLVRVFLWTIPILGFIGTVLGIGAAVGGFASFLARAQEIDQIKGALGEVTSGLGVAFDTTFVGLLLSVVLMIVMSAVEKRERDQLYAIEGYCQDRLLRRLPRERTAAKPREAILSDEMRQMVRDGLSAWQREVDRLARELSGTLAESWRQAGSEWFAGLRELQREGEASWQKYREEREKTGEERFALTLEINSLVERMKGLFQAEETAARELVASRNAEARESATRQAELARHYAEALVSVSGKLENLVSLQRALERDLREASASGELKQVLTAVQVTLEQLRPTLARLTEKPIDVKVQFVAGAPGIVS